MIRCTQPGCTGTVEDGYCVQCGMAPGLSGPSASAASAPAGRCTQPGCAYTVEDGYCTTCGMAPAPAAKPAAPAPEAPRPPPCPMGGAAGRAATA